MTKEIHLAAGCFWGAEHFLKLIEGVTCTETGFANGNTENPTYEEVYTDATGFAETVRVQYNPEKISLESLLRLYFQSIDPTSINRQGEDVGTRYRTGIYYSDLSDLPVIMGLMREEAAKHSEPLAVEVLPLSNFYRADAYHQGYLERNPGGYCHLPQALFDLARSFREEKDTAERSGAGTPQ